MSMPVLCLFPYNMRAPLFWSVCTLCQSSSKYDDDRSTISPTLVRESILNIVQGPTVVFWAQLELTSCLVKMTCHPRLRPVFRSLDKWHWACQVNLKGDPPKITCASCLKGRHASFVTKLIHVRDMNHVQDMPQCETWLMYETWPMCETCLTNSHQGPWPTDRWQQIWVRACPSAEPPDTKKIPKNSRNFKYQRMREPLIVCVCACGGVYACVTHSNSCESTSSAAFDMWIQIHCFRLRIVEKRLESPITNWHLHIWKESYVTDNKVICMHGSMPNVSQSQKHVKRDLHISKETYVTDIKLICMYGYMPNISITSIQVSFHMFFPEEAMRGSRPYARLPASKFSMCLFTWPGMSLLRSLWRTSQNDSKNIISPKIKGIDFDLCFLARTWPPPPGFWSAPAASWSWGTPKMSKEQYCVWTWNNYLLNNHIQKALCVLPESIGNNFFLIRGHFFDDERWFLGWQYFSTCRYTASGCRVANCLACVVKTNVWCRICGGMNVWCHLRRALLLLVTKILQSHKLIQCLIHIISLLGEHKRVFPLIRKPHVHQRFLISMKILQVYRCCSWHDCQC